jgi:NAD(P)H-flavin reductase
LEVKGPIEKIKYTPNMKQKIGMIAAGTGITPMLQAYIHTLIKYIQTEKHTCTHTCMD